jgi:hypothetical protein
MFKHKVSLRPCCYSYSFSNSSKRQSLVDFLVFSVMILVSEILFLLESPAPGNSLLSYRVTHSLSCLSLKSVYLIVCVSFLRTLDKGKLYIY